MSRVLLVPDLPLEQWPSMDRYALRLAHALAQADPPDLDISMAGPAGTLGDASARSVSAWRRYLARYWRYPRRVRRQRTHILHVLDHSYAHILTGRSVPGIVTVHDLLPVMVLERPATRARDRLRNALLRRSLAGVRSADAWIVSTAWMAGELATWLGRSDHIHVIPYGADDAFFQEGTPTDRARGRTTAGATDDTFLLLHVGSVTDRKNLPGVLAALAGLRARGINARLCQVGGRFTPAQHRLIAQQGLGPHVHQTPRATEVQLIEAYRSADVLLFPSLYEGFGLPVLEAMAVGLPVVVSNIPAL
ncbi:MAG: glycosyltransferase family 1 protein, partial [Gemmatimonadales bacterium]